MSSYWPYTLQPSSVATHYYSPSLTEHQVRQIVAEELQKALHPEESRPSATVEYVIEGKRYKGTVYLVEDEEEE